MAHLWLAQAASLWVNGDRSPGPWGCVEPRVGHQPWGGEPGSPLREGLEGLNLSLSPQDYISLFPLDDTQPSKLMRLLSSNDEDGNTLSSPSKCGWGRHRPALPLVSGCEMYLGTKLLLFPSCR